MLAVLWAPACTISLIYFRPKASNCWRHQLQLSLCCLYFLLSYWEIFIILSRIGDDLLSHSLSCSTIGATMLNFRVRDGIGCFIGAMITKPRQNNIDCYFNQTLCSKLSILCGNCVWLLDFSRQVCLLLDQIKPIGPLVPVSWTCYHAYTSGLSTRWSTSVLRDTLFWVGLPA